MIKLNYQNKIHSYGGSIDTQQGQREKFSYLDEDFFSSPASMEADVLKRTKQKKKIWMSEVCKVEIDQRKNTLEWVMRKQQRQELK